MVLKIKSLTPECEGCINHYLDPFQCEDCQRGSCWEGDDTTEELSFAEFKDFILRNQ